MTAGRHVRPGIEVRDELDSKDHGGEIVPTSSRINLTYNVRGLRGFLRGANGYSDIGRAQTNRTRADPVSASASDPTTVKYVHPVRKADAG